MERYAKQIRFAPIGEEGQRKLQQARVLIAGMGALGTHLANSLARAGVGYLKVIDRDFVELSNLQRQVLYDEEDVEEILPKAIAAQRKLEKINSSIVVEAEVVDISWANVQQHFEGIDLVVDGSDNFELRFLINDCAVKKKIPWIYGGITGSQGMAMVIRPFEGPCLRCIMPKAPTPGSMPTCDTAGVLGPTVQMVTAFQTAEAIKVLTGQDDKVCQGLLNIDLWTSRYEVFDLSKASRPQCPACGQGEFPFLEGREEIQVTPICGSNAVQINPVGEKKLNLQDIARRLASLGEISQNPYLLKFNADGQEMVLFMDGRAMLKGTQDSVKAKSFYSRYVGF
ncbi:thiazole biosynthesis adenylyltransferase ThiF [Heliorestis acidaminivorans]|uniref:Thiazole biosynthesis adenylyltransferase ThiF n=1 Tax=Heliorestis acidaminivorans TaxID=553427 RepID=A0A6I0F3F6_9FIRM|nr:ThiF family adenylyltransferase [Heliorestis acidaminivorans]KAB2954531.1 thiazole biosynthesis adenylyltransferase ThiF [Heliorestis acidaminivorans]